MTETIKLRTVLAASGRWSRRKLRRSRDVAFFDAGTIALEESVTLSEDWTPFTFRGEKMRARVAAPLCLVLNKPVDSITSRRPDADVPSVFEFLDPAAADRVEPVGRLDRDTHGVLLFTEDGQLLHRLTHPKRKVLRTYVAHLSEPLEDKAAEALRGGRVELDDGHIPRPVFVEASDSSSVVRVGLTEGKYHEVRRMFAAVGSPVAELRRTDYAGITVEGLPDGAWRRIDGSELERLYALVGSVVPEGSLYVELVDG